jgi:hypothetical protein
LVGFEVSLYLLPDLQIDRALGGILYLYIHKLLY